MLFTHVNLIVQTMDDFPGWLRDLAQEANDLVIAHGVIVRAKLVTKHTAMLSVSPWRDDVDWSLLRSRLTLVCNRRFVHDSKFLFFSFAHRERVLQSA